MGTLDIGPAVPGGFPTNMQVTVMGGPYKGDVGVVIDQSPDLRPGSVWVQLTRFGIRLVPGYRLVPAVVAARADA